MHVDGPLTAQADKDLEHADGGDADEAGLVIIVQSVDEHPAVDPDELRQNEWQHVTVEEQLAWIMETHALHEFVRLRRGRR